MNFKYTLDDKRYHTFNYYLKTKYKTKVAKISLNANFTCPNKDGTVAKGGCLFCSDSGSGDFAGNPQDNLQIQFDKVSKMMSSKWPNCSYIAYFQANTNTYGSVEKLKETFEPFVHKKNVVGIDIATRPDCLQDDIIEYLADLNQRTDLWVELGLQTIHQSSADWFNRGYDLDTFEIALKKLRAHHINVCVHIINGLPVETKEQMIETAKYLGNQDIQGIKIHMLYALKNSKIANYMTLKHIDFMSREEYIDLVVKQLEYIPSHVVIQRLTGDGKQSELYGPMWSIKKVTILNDITKKMKELDTYQGIKHNSSTNNKSTNY